MIECELFSPFSLEKGDVDSTNEHLTEHPQSNMGANVFLLKRTNMVLKVVRNGKCPTLTWNGLTYLEHSTARNARNNLCRRLSSKMKLSIVWNKVQPKQCFPWPKAITKDFHIDHLMPPDLPETMSGDFSSSVPPRGVCGITILGLKASLFSSLISHTYPVNGTLIHTRRGNARRETPKNSLREVVVHDIAHRKVVLF